MNTALVKFSVEKAKSLEDLIRDAEAEAEAMVDTSSKVTFHSATIVALTTGIQGDFTYRVKFGK